MAAGIVRIGAVIVPGAASSPAAPSTKIAPATSPSMPSQFESMNDGSGGSVVACGVQGPSTVQTNDAPAVSIPSLTATATGHEPPVSSARVPEITPLCGSIARFG